MTLGRSKWREEGGDWEEKRRRRVHQLEKEKLELTSKHNQEVCGLQAELTRLRCSVEGGEAQREELQYQITVSQRESTRDKHTLTELQVTVAELQKSLDITRRCREEDQHALQQEVEERDKLIHTLSSENQRLHQLLQDQEEALEEAQREREKEEEERRREHSKLKYLEEKEERSRREKEVLDQRVKTLEANMERLLAGCVLLRQPQSMLGNFTWQELCDVINEQVGQVTSDLREANDTVSRSQLSSLRHHASSMTSDLSLLRGEASCFLWACVLLGGALTHTHLRLQQVCVQKRVVCRRLQEREGLEGEVRSLLGALGKEEEEEEGRKRKMAVRRWRKSVCVVMAVRRWCLISKHTAVVFRLQKGGGCSATETQEGQITPTSDADGGVCARWLRSKRLSSVILSSMADLQGALTHSGSSPPDVTPLARSALSRLLDHLLDQSEAKSGLSGSGLDEDSLSGRLRGGLNRVTPPQPDSKALVSTLQQHFLVFSQRLHSAEVERRGLRLEVANLKTGLRQEREESCKTVPEQQFHSVCVELRQALSREQEVQTLLQEQTDAQHTLGQTAQSLCDARQEVTRKDRSLRILGKHLSGVQRERKHLEEELSDTHRHRDCLISNMKAAETSYKQVRESLVQSRGGLLAKPRPLPAVKEHLSGAGCIMGAPELAACQTLLSSASQLFLACCSRIGWLEQEVSAHISHVTALRGELQEVCLRDNLAFIPVEGFPEAFPLADVETWQAVPLSDWSNELPVSLNPAPFSPLSKEVKKKRGGRKQI
ncbi:coiled-coil domain-containing protein 171 [Notothenia coriiceps]|uniref:Coiled-coil domain-containing protein 171 n=1 Tax=Notothenia coriiceps TaxID=8208 RepID=A0A6I9NQ27_9TELE|nr:PREDICTED: coiled-coil domain-containing protein 171 [Notothenia coriiceps]